MKKVYTLLLSFFVVAATFAQATNITWTFVSKKKSADTYEIVVTANVAKPWHIYSQNTGDGGPLPTKFTFNANPLVTIVGKTAEKGKLVKTHDKNFNTNVLFYSNTVTFTQTVKVKAGVKTNLTGNVNYMLCDDEKCLAPTKKTFDIKLQ